MFKLKAKLADALCTIWKLRSVGCIRNLHASILRQLQFVIVKKEFPTKYWHFRVISVCFNVKKLCFFVAKLYTLPPCWLLTFCHTKRKRKNFITINKSVKSCYSMRKFVFCWRCRRVACRISICRVRRLTRVAGFEGLSLTPTTCVLPPPMHWFNSIRSFLSTVLCGISAELWSVTSVNHALSLVQCSQQCYLNNSKLVGLSMVICAEKNVSICRLINLSWL